VLGAQIGDDLYMKTTNNTLKLRTMATLLMVRNAQAGMAGKSVPVAVRAAMRLEATLARTDAFAAQVNEWIEDAAVSAERSK
jgi:hypothetical protein